MLVLINGLQAANLSGTGTYVKQLARLLPSVSDDFDYATVWPSGLEVPVMPKDAHQAFLRRNTSGAFSRFSFDQMGMFNERKRACADIVHYPASVGNIFGMWNEVITIHDCAYLHNPYWFSTNRSAYYRFFISLSAKKAKRIIADSKATAADLSESLGVAEDRIDVVPLGVDTEHYAPADAQDQEEVCKKYGLPESFFLYMGTLEPRKNIVRIIEAFSLIAGESSHDLVIAGRKGWKSGPIFKAAESSEFRDRIKFTGFVDHDDQPALMSAAAVFVWPSLWEGFGLPPLEAMACGTPVVTSKVSSLPEVVGDSALCVDPHSVDAIAEAMLSAETDGELRGRLRRQGLERVKGFSWQRTAELTVESYRATLHS